MSTGIWIFYALWAVVGFVVLYMMANSRGRNPILWGIFGAITFLIAVIAILIAGDAKESPPAPTPPS